MIDLPFQFASTPDAGPPPAADLVHYRRKEHNLNVVSTIVVEMMPSAVPASLPARRQSSKLLLNDFEIGFR